MALPGDILPPNPEDNFIGPKDLLESGTSFVTTLYEVSNNITQLRVEEAEKRILSKKAEQELTFALTDATLEISTFIGLPVDPSTGKSNKDYTKLKVMHELQNHGEYQKAVKLFAEIEAAHIQAQVAMRNAMDVFTAVRGGANLVAAMMYFLTDNRPVMLVGDKKE